MESGNNYNAVNSIGAMGKYQFMNVTLNFLRDVYKLPDWKNAAYFCADTTLQELYEKYQIKHSQQYIYDNKLFLHYGKVVTASKIYKGQTANINLYGMLAAAHLSGLGNLVKYFNNGNDPNDGNASLTDYLYYFSKNV